MCFLVFICICCGQRGTRQQQYCCLVPCCMQYVCFAAGAEGSNIITALHLAVCFGAGYRAAILLLLCTLLYVFRSRVQGSNNIAASYPAVVGQWLQQAKGQQSYCYFAFCCIRPVSQQAFFVAIILLPCTLLQSAIFARGQIFRSNNIAASYPAVSIDSSN